MKKLIFTFLIAFTVLFTSCDYVSNPYPEKNANLSDTSSCPTATFPTVTAHVKKILIEDFTGHTCPNCPKAAAELYKLDTMTAYHGKIIGLAEHVGSFAAPAPTYYAAVPGSFMSDYTTTVGDAYNTVFTPYAIGLPQGMMNRKSFDASLDHLKFYVNWESIIFPYSTEPSVVDLQISVNYDASTRKICCAVKDSFLTTVNHSLNLVVVLSQDSIKDWQDSASVVRSSYTFNHMLRDAITPKGAWGETLVVGSAPAGLTQVRHFAYTIPASYKGIPCIPKNCHLVAFIYNTDITSYEIYQSEEVKVSP